MDFSLEMRYEFGFSMKDTCDVALEFGKSNALTVYAPYFAESRTGSELLC